MNERRPLDYFTLLRTQHDFRRLWTGDVVSQLGDWFNTIAIYVAVQSMTSSAQALAAVFAAKTLPTLLIAPVAGPLADRYDRRRLLIVSDLVRAVAVLGLIVAHAHQSLAGLLAMLVLICAGSGVSTPARNAALPMLVSRRDLPAANALEAATWSVMLAAGAALGGAATEWLGATAALTIDAGTFVLSAMIFLRLPSLSPKAKSGGASPNLSAGLRYIRANQDVFRIAMLKPMMSLGSAVIVLVPVIALELDPVTTALTIGALYGARGLGALIGSLAPRALLGDADSTMRQVTWFGFVAMAAGIGALGMTDSIVWAMAALFVMSIGSGIVWTFSTTLLATNADERFHGRVFALEHGAMTLVFSVAGWGLTAIVDFGGDVEHAVLAAAAALMVPLWAQLPAPGVRDADLAPDAASW